MPNWTAAQQQAIQARNHTILVSAAAGSGKTAVLIERIVSLIREGVRLDRMLIVTFTRAAAAEMRQRLNQRLLKEVQSEPKQMGQALDDLEHAMISTIHGFCQRVLHNDFQAAGIDPMARTCDDQQRRALFDQASDAALNELLEDETASAFHALTDAFELQELKDMTVQLYNFLMALPDPFDWLADRVGESDHQPVDEHPWYQVLVNHSAIQLSGISSILSMQRAMFDEPDACDALFETFQADYDACQQIISGDFGTPRAMQEALATFGFVKAKSVRKPTPEQEAWKKRYTKLRNDLKALVNDAAKGLWVDEQKTGRELRQIKEHLSGLAMLVNRTHQHFQQLKAEANVIDFSDMEHMTLAILRQDALRTRMQGEYDHIFVDECQDVSAAQDAILQAIHGENSCLFMVGDVKQSIYRFRLADPTLFLSRMRTYADDADAENRRIFLQQNFRSRSAILDATNRVFRRVMKPKVTELDYLPQDELMPGRVSQDDPPVEIHIAADDDLNAAQTLEAQADIFVSLAQELTKQTFMDGEQERHFTWRDMVILMPKLAHEGTMLSELLQNRGIPVYFDGADSYFGLPEIRAMTELLKTIDNPMQDLPLMAALRMEPFHFSDEEMTEIRLTKGEQKTPFYEAFKEACHREDGLGQRCESARQRLNEWRFLAETVRLSDYIWLLIQQTGLYAACGAMPDGSLRQANLRLLCQRAAEAEQIGCVTLRDFLRQIETMSVGGDSRSAKVLGENENLVRIMTIHKSKGLEFPAVFCLGLGGQLHLANRGTIRMHGKLGVCLPYVNSKLRIRRKTMGETAFDTQRLLDEKAEKARLLYVAMTRARERLFLLGGAPEQGCPVWSMEDGAYRVWSANSLLDWVMQVVKEELGEENTESVSTGYQQAANPWKIKVWSNPSPQAVEKKKVIHNLKEWLDSVVSVKAGEELGKKWANLYQPVEFLPLKSSVSAMVRRQTLHDPLPLTEEEESEEDKRQAETIVSPLRLSELPSMPDFMTEAHLTGAARGTVIHHVLSLVSLDTLRAASDRQTALAAELDRLQATGVLSKEEAAAVPVDGLMRFFESPLGVRMLAARRVEREWSFNLKLSHERDALMQGVIDCAFREEDGWVLLDYKTDHILDEAAFVERYTMQLTLYAQALRELTNAPVKEAWLYAIEKHKAYAVEE